MPESYSWNLVSEPVSGSVPNPGPYTPSPASFGGTDPRKLQFERGIKFANVPGGRADFVVHGGPRVYHVNSVSNLLSEPSDREVKKNPQQGYGSNGYSGAVRFRRVRIPHVVSPKEGRNTDTFGNEQLFPSYSASAKFGHILDPNTLVLWRLDEEEGSLGADLASGSTTLQMFSDPPIVTGRVGHGRYQTGSAEPTQLIQAPVTGSIVTQLQNEWTVEMWIRPDPVQDPNTILLILNGLNFSISPEDKIILQFQIDDELKLCATTWPTYITNAFVVFPDAIVEAEQWTHVALSRVSQSSQYKYLAYVNGVKKNESALFNPPDIVSGSGTHFFGVGSYITNGGIGTGGSLFAGSVDDIRISKVARTDAEIFESYTRGAIGI